MTMDEKKPAKSESLVNLIESVLRGTASEAQRRELGARLSASDEDRKLYLHRMNLHSALRCRFAYSSENQIPVPLDLSADMRNSGRARPGRKSRLAKWVWASVAAAAAVLIAGIYFLHPGAEPQIATIIEMNGALVWTGDGGRVDRDLEEGQSLRGGTMETLSANSWVKFEFRDGSTVTMSGQSVLTITAREPKVLHLRRGSLSAGVTPQRPGNPMVIHTPTAQMEVLGTQFNLVAEPSSTMLTVNEGKVRVTRLSDGRTADVPADHQVVASASLGPDFNVTSRPVSVSTWRSNLPLGALHGRWIRETRSLRAAPLLWRGSKKKKDKPVLLYIASLAASRGGRAPVELCGGAKFRIRGRIESAADSVLIGLTTRHLKGGLVGRYHAVRRAESFPSEGGEFDLEVRIEEFTPDEPGRQPDSPIGLDLLEWWCLTINKDAGLSVIDAELLSPAGSADVARHATTKQRRMPVVDIWVAAAQGDVEAVKRHLAAGAEINAAFVAPGIPASGATPLHLAVLFNQSEMVRFLVGKGADLGSRAKDKHGGTPLHWAAALGNIGMAELLIESGADVNASDNNGFTPLDATNYDRESPGKAKLKIAELLRRKGGKYAKERKE